MRPLRLRTATIAAACAHAVAAMAFVRLPPRPHAAPSPIDAAELLVDAPPLEPSPRSPSAPRDARAREAAVAPMRDVAPHASRDPLSRAPADGSPRMPDDASAALATEAPTGGNDARGNDAWTIAPPAPIALGVGDYWKHVAASDAAWLSADPSTAPARAPDRILRDSLESSDRARGLGRGGALVTAAREAASPAIAPDEGSATLEVDADASGIVRTARALDASSDLPAWNDVARELVRLMAGKPLPLRAGARGFRARLGIVAAHRAPSGDRGASSAGAVPDDAPGGDRACEGTGIERRCVAGLPLGFSTSGNDVTNLGARRIRVVQVQLLDEETL